MCPVRVLAVVWSESKPAVLSCCPSYEGKGSRLKLNRLTKIPRGASEAEGPVLRRIDGTTKVVPDET